MEERRGFPRIPKEARVDIRELSYPMMQNDLKQGSGRDISPGGICIRIEGFMNKGTLVEMKLDLSGVHAFKKSSMFVDKTAMAPLTVIGKVVWCKPGPDKGGFEAGIEFVDIYEDDRMALEKYLIKQAG